VDALPVRFFNMETRSMPKSEHFADYPDADGYAMVIASITRWAGIPVERDVSKKNRMLMC